MEPVPGLKLELRAEQTPMREVEEPREEGVVGGWLPVARIRVKPDVEGLDQGLAMLLAAGVLVQGVVSREQQLEDFTRRRERSIGRQEDVYVGGLQLAVVVRQALDQPLHRPGFQETHPHRFPFQVRDLVVRILYIGRMFLCQKLFEWLSLSYENYYTLGIFYLSEVNQRIKILRKMYIFLW